MRKWLFQIVPLAVAAAGCFNPAFENVQCGQDGACPEGLACASDGVCRLGDEPPPEEGGLIVHLACEDDPDDNGLRDDSGNDLRAFCDPGPGCPDNAPGVIGSACSFDGDSERAEIPHDPILDTPAAFTVALWFQTSQLEAWLSMAAKPVGNGFGNSWQLELVPTEACGNGTQLSFTANQLLCAPQPIALDEWHHAAGVWNGAEKILYLDGVEVARAPDAVEFDDSDVVIGADINQGSPDEHWNGLIDEVQLYGRALAADEIADLARVP